MNAVIALRLVGVMQLAIAGLNLFLIPLLKWRPELARMPLLLREVFQVHLWFISVTLAIFGTLTCRFAGQIAGAHDSLARWLAASIGLFWLLRTCLQIGFYSGEHWKGKAKETCTHVALLLVYGGFSAVYLNVAFTWRFVCY